MPPAVTPYSPSTAPSSASPSTRPVWPSRACAPARFVRRACGAILLGSALLAITGAATGCKDRAKQSQAAAKVDIAMLVTLANEDVAEIERGLPEGAKRMAAQIGKEPEPSKNAPAVRTALLKMRQQVPDLGKAKSTFFAFTDEKGIAIRNDLEQDTMAGKDVVSAYPDLKRALAGEAFVTTNGEFPGAPNPAGPDREWIAGMPVKKDDGSLAGLLVTGWTYRRFAYHLQESLKRDIQDQLMRGGDKGKLPVLYVCLFDGNRVYGPRGTPPVNEQALAELHLAEKTKDGPAEGTIDITDRAFGWAAALVPKLGPDVGVVVLRSEI